MLAAILSIALISGQALFINSMLQGRNTIAGRIATTEDKPIDSVRVTLMNELLSVVGIAYTDNSGRYRFDGVNKGNYTVLVEPSGTDYEQKSAQVEVNPFSSTPGGSQSYRIDFFLRAVEKKGNRSPDLTNIVFYQNVPGAAKKEYNRGKDAIKKGDFEAAAKSLNRALEIFPDYYDALEALGTEHVKRREYQAALPMLTRAVGINKGDWRSFYALGIALTELNQVSEAIKPLRRAVELNPDSAHTNMRLGIALTEDDATRAEAMEALKEAIRIDESRVPEAHLFIASLFNKNKQYREAAEAIEAYLRVAPQNEHHAKQREHYKQVLEQMRQKAMAGPQND